MVGINPLAEILFGSFPHFKIIDFFLASEF